jgi:predicted O-methyltransferase YrrM
VIRCPSDVPVRNIARTARRIQRAAQWSLRVYRLGLSKNRFTRAAAASIRVAFKPAWTPAERVWVDSIEGIRASMNASTEPLTRTDFGVPSPRSGRTEQEMQAGVETVDTVGHFAELSSKPAFWCHFLFRLIRSARPSSCVELGTAVGISTAYQAAALKLNGRGTLVTLEGAASLAKIADSNLRALGLATEIVVGRFDDTLLHVLQKRQPVDYVFVDGHHDERATLRYFERALPFLADSALIVFDDIAWSDGMTRAWRVIAHDPRVTASVDLGSIGLCVIDRAAASRGRYFDIPLD